MIEIYFFIHLNYECQIYRFRASEDITTNFKFLDLILNLLSTEPAGENLPEKHFYKITKPFSKQNRSEIQKIKNLFRFPPKEDRSEREIN